MRAPALIAAWLVYQTTFSGDASQISVARPFSSLRACEKNIPDAVADIEHAKSIAVKAGTFVRVLTAPHCTEIAPLNWIPYGERN